MRFYVGLRADVSLLLANGHPNARHLPIAVVWSEARLIRRREALRMQREALLLHSAVSSLLAGGDGFEKLMKEIGNVG